LADPTAISPGSARSSIVSPARDAGWGSMMAMRVMGQPSQPKLNLF
jgi:hypothetical protein